jgi:hypothetical protein
MSASKWNSGEEKFELNKNEIIKLESVGSYKPYYEWADSNGTNLGKHIGIIENNEVFEMTDKLKPIQMNDDALIHRL